MHALVVCIWLHSDQNQTFFAGINTETISIGRYVEIFNVARGFTPEEAQHFADLAQRHYQRFVDKAAASRSMSVEAMEEVLTHAVSPVNESVDRQLNDV